MVGMISVISSNVNLIGNRRISFSAARRSVNEVFLTRTFALLNIRGIFYRNQNLSVIPKAVS